MSRISRLKPVTLADLKKDFHLAIPLQDYNWIVQKGLDPRSLLLRKVHELQQQEEEKELTPEEVRAIGEAKQREWEAFKARAAEQKPPTVSECSNSTPGAEKGDP